MATVKRKTSCYADGGEPKSRKSQVYDANGKQSDYDPFADVRKKYGTPGTSFRGDQLPNASPRMRPLMEDEMNKERGKKGYAEGGKVRDEAIDFTGDELDELERTSKSDARGSRGIAGADAFINQARKGKSLGAASDASDVVRGFTRAGTPMYPGSKAEETREYRKHSYSGGNKKTAFAEGGKVPPRRKPVRELDEDRKGAENWLDNDKRAGAPRIGDDIGEREMREGESVKDYNERQYRAERAGRVPKWNTDGRDAYEMETGRKPRGQAYAKGGNVKHDDAKADKKLIKTELMKFQKKDAKADKAGGNPFAKRKGYSSGGKVARGMGAAMRGGKYCS